MEFVCWQIRRRRRINEFHREDYFWANIAKLFLQANCKDPKKVTIEPFLLKFIEEEKKIPVEHKQNVRNSKNFWASLTGAIIDDEEENYVMETEDITENQLTQRIQDSKNFWAASVGAVIPPVKD